VINALLAEDTLARANQFMAEQGTDFMDRALSWTFLHETESSFAMKRHERDYLTALQAYSAPARACWDVTWIGDEDYDFKFKADDTIYRYWNATTAVAFCLQMAKEALEQDLKEETQFLMQFDRVYKTVDAAEDIRGNDLTLLVRSALQNEGKISTNRRKQFQATVTETAFDLIEAACREERSS
jgi:hypothetical protein